ncbi:MAG: hypothetical protein ACO1TH_22815 [Luteitalea sp.]
MMTRLLLASLLVGTVHVSAAPETHVGLVTDTMCARDHAAMKITPVHKCVKDCVGDGKTYKYALLVGAKVYPLSDQATPAKFAGQKVKVTGQLYPKTGILRADRIEPVK